MIRQKKEIKRIIIVVIFILIVFLSNVQFINHSNLLKENINNDNQLNKSPNSANLEIDNYITGFGVDQDVRVYVNNKSENLNDNQNFFEIPSITSDNMYLTYGDFNFTFQNNFTTEYIIEDNDALYAEKFISFSYDKSNSEITIYNGTLFDGAKANLKDGNYNNYVTYNATNGILNFTIKANFTGEKYSDDTLNGDVIFNRSNILGLIYSLWIYINKNANLTIRIKDYSQSTWKEIISKLPVDSSLNKQELTKHFINENLNFIDLTDTCYIQFIFERDDQSWFNAQLYEFDMNSTYAFDLAITDQDYVALEFDLKGENSTVNGFYAWIRTLDLNEAASTNLNITLYRSNATVVRTDGNLRKLKMIPDYNEMIDSQLVNYNNDQLSYFEFNTVNTQDLNLSNYFVVIKSNNSKQVYSLVTIPYFNFGEAEGRTEHQLIITNNDGISWKLSEKVVDTNYQDYTIRQLDASSFKLNVTRGYMPSDFIFDNNNTLRIQDMTIDNLVISSYPYNESSYLTWGLGRWNHAFTTIIENGSTNKFKVNLNWNRSIIEGFKFNVNYSVNTYWIKGAVAYYNATYNDNPEWTLNFDFNKTDPNFLNWDFIEFWFVYPNFMNAHNLTNPDDEEFLWLLDQESILIDSPSNFKLVINKTFSNLEGIYSLNLTSFNFIDDMHSYINYYGTLWETNGFMYGDNISISVDVQDHNFKAPLSGNVNATLFYPNGTRYPGADLISSSGFVDGSILSYDFNNNSILNVTKDISEFGEYELGFFWFNGSAIGCKKLTIYIDIYDLQLLNCTFLSNLDSNVLIGQLYQHPKKFPDYTILIASINDTTVISTPNYYPINNSDLNKKYSYNLDGQELSILMNSFLQSEDILNPNETVNFRVTIQNTHPFIPVDVKINIKLVSYINEDWIIAENTSSIINLDFSGTPNDTFEFNLDLKIPELDVIKNTWEGLNAPIRLGGAKAIVTLTIEDFEVGLFESTYLSLLSNKTSDNFEGNILGLTVDDMKSPNLLFEFERDVCLYYPDNTSFLVNIIDENYISSYKQFDKKFSLNLNSKFNNIKINPESPRTGEIINVSSILTTEFGDVLSAKNVTCEYYGSNSNWVNIGSYLTNVSGSVAFLINTAAIDFDKEEDLILRLSWDGDIVNGVSKNITINLIKEVNNFSISIRQNDNFIYKSKSATLKIAIFNLGDSNLRFFNRTISIEGNLPHSIVEINNIKLNKLEPGERTEIIIEIKISQVDTLEVNFSISAQNILTGEIITVSEHSSFTVFDKPLLDYFIELFMFIMIIVIALIWILAITYALRVRKRIEEPVEEIERKPRKGKYVMVSDLKKPALPKKIAKKKEEVKPEKRTDLDSLLEERGLSDKKKKQNK